MNLFKRFTATFSGSLEQAVAHIENHDAVVEVALRDTRKAAAKAKVRLARVQRDGRELDMRKGELEAAVEQWTARAKNAAKDDEEKALNCLQRRNQSQKALEATNRAIADHAAREGDLTQAVQRIEERLREIESTRNLLRTRQSAAEANKSVAKLTVSDCYQVDDVLERWEMNILETEYAAPSTSTTDAFESDFVEQEARDDLKSQLDDLMNDTGSES